MIPGSIPSYVATGDGGRPVQVHLISRQAPSFQEMAELLQRAQAHPPSDPFQVLELPGELAVVTGGLPSEVGFEEWIRDAVSETQTPIPSGDQPSFPAEEESYTQFFQVRQDPPTSQPPSAIEKPGSDPDYSEFFQAPAADPTPATTPAPPLSVPTEPAVSAPPGQPPTEPQARTPVAPPPDPSPPYQAAPPPIQEPDPESITAEFRRPMPPPMPGMEPGRSRNWVPSQRGAEPQALAMGDYLARLDSSSGSPMSGPPRPPVTPVTPAAPSWGSDGGAPSGATGREGTSAPTVVTRAPTPQGAGTTSGKGLRKRDLVIFGTVVGLVVIAAIVTVVVVLLTAG
ncbi:MAG: hypothetical protein KJN92_04615 [Gemmatimonadetes bacterium]|nr:hypothetical protein [Gemmatimonadota bacterium]